jgi:tRNA(fMet)-specific endonuclease VapC
MLKYLLDTNICIYAIKRKPVQVRRALNAHRGQVAISAVTLMELFYGAEKSSSPRGNLEVIESFAARLTVLAYDNAAASCTAQLRAEQAAAGTQIGAYDQMIAGHARSQGLTVVTNNLREYARVPGLVLEDWSS